MTYRKNRFKTAVKLTNHIAHKDVAAMYKYNKRFTKSKAIRKTRSQNFVNFAAVNKENQGLNKCIGKARNHLIGRRPKNHFINKENQEVNNNKKTAEKKIISPTTKRNTLNKENQLNNNAKVLEKNTETVKTPTRHTKILKSPTNTKECNNIFQYNEGILEKTDRITRSKITVNVNDSNILENIAKVENCNAKTTEKSIERPKTPPKNKIDEPIIKENKAEDILKTERKTRSIPSKHTNKTNHIMTKENKDVKTEEKDIKTRSKSLVNINNNELNAKPIVFNETNDQEKKIKNVSVLLTRLDMDAFLENNKPESLLKSAKRKSTDHNENNKPESIIKKTERNSIEHIESTEIKDKIIIKEETEPDYIPIPEDVDLKNEVALIPLVVLERLDVNTFKENKPNLNKLRVKVAKTQKAVKTKKIKEPKPEEEEFIVIFNEEHNGSVVYNQNSFKVKKYFCDLCSKSYQHQFSLRNHQLIKHDIPSETAQVKYTCFTCNGNFAVKSELRRHLECHQLNTHRKRMLAFYKTFRTPGDRTLRCNMCEYTSKNTTYFNSHYKKHTGIRDHKCNICGKEFRGRASLRGHISDVHMKTPRYTCALCGKQFVYRDMFLDHKNVHFNRKPYLCEVCGECFAKKRALRAHKFYHLKQMEHTCNLCGKVFRRRAELNCHLKYHSKERPIQCPKCPSKFKMQCDLRRHLLRHDRTVECICLICGRTCKQLRYLQRHLRTHFKKNNS